MNKTTFEKGIITGVQNTVLLQGEKRLGPPSKDVEALIRSIQDTGFLEILSERIIDAKSWSDVIEGAKAHSP